jgi:hypothetical protein
MAGMPKRRARKERSKSFTELNNALEIICMHIASAGNLVTFCQMHDIHYGTVLAWIQSDEKRQEQFTKAMNAREQHAKEFVLRELIEHRQADLLDAFNEDGAMKQLSDIPVGLRRLISSLKVEELFEDVEEPMDPKNPKSPKVKKRVLIGYLKEIKVMDKARTNETLARHLKMLTDKLSVGVDLTTEEVVEKSWRTNQVKKS